MTVFVVVAARSADALAKIVKDRFGDDSLQAFPTTWFVSAPLTTKEVSAALQLPDGQAEAQAIVFPVTNYHGWAPKGIWEWLRSRDAVATNG